MKFTSMQSALAVGALSAVAVPALADNASGSPAELVLYVVNTANNTAYSRGLQINMNNLAISGAFSASGYTSTFTGNISPGSTVEMGIVTAEAVANGYTTGYGSQNVLSINYTLPAIMADANLTSFLSAPGGTFKWSIQSSGNGGGNGTLFFRRFITTSANTYDNGTNVTTGNLGMAGTDANAWTDIVSMVILDNAANPSVTNGDGTSITNSNYLSYVGPGSGTASNWFSTATSVAGAINALVDLGSVANLYEVISCCGATQSAGSKDWVLTLNDVTMDASGNINGLSLPPSHYVIPNITGLGNGKCVVLNDGSTLNQTKTFCNNGSTPFNAPLNVGLSYNVTVTGQPAGQLCSVVPPGGGTMGNADVTVFLTCNDITYTIGGAVTGLDSGESITLLKNGGNALTVSSPPSPTPFTFTQPVVSGGSYDVTVQAAPPGKTCLVSNGSGTATSNVTNVSISCGWTPFSLSGTIVDAIGNPGLNASGLALRLTNTTTGISSILFPSVGSTSFNFATPVLTYGQGYQFSVLTQPGGQLCTPTTVTGTTGTSAPSVVLVCAGSYTVGGSISGYTGPGLVLRLNSTNLIIPSNASAFKFATALTTGATYTVSVGIQPPGQNCSIGNGSGTIVNANINNVSITCKNTHTVGGPVTGLTVPGLTLRLFSAADAGTLSTSPTSALKIVSGGSSAYSFSTALTANSYFYVAVNSQPTGRYCYLTNAGTVTQPRVMPDTNVSDIGVTCVGTFTVGGTVSGLGSGKSLTLQNIVLPGPALASIPGAIFPALPNSAVESKTISVNGAFSFSNKVPDQFSGTVSVQTQPVGQRCTVIPSSYIVAGSNLNTLSVTCVDMPKVTAVVTGNTGTVALTNTTSTGVEPCSVAAGGGTCVFAPQESGSSYDLEIVNQPISQICTPSFLHGTLNSDVTVNVTCITKQFRASGFVTGNTGPVTLTNNGGSPQTISTGGGSYAFPKQDYGTTWNVVVSNAPAGQRCYVFNHTGTITLDYSNVNVNCTAAYTVGGNVSGLAAGTTLKLVKTVTQARPSIFNTEAGVEISNVGAVNDNPGNPATMGWGFTLNNTTTLTHLGAWIGGGIYGDINVGLWNSAGTLLTSTTLAVNNFSALQVEGDFGYMPLAQNVNLLAGQQYTIGAFYNGGVVAAHSSVVSPINGLNYVSPSLVNFAGSGLAMPTTDFSGTIANGFFGPDLRFATPVLGNDSEEITIAANGAFTFPAMVADGDSYAVTLSAQPANQNCVINNGAGAISGANINTVTVTCAAYLAGTTSGYSTVGPNLLALTLTDTTVSSALQTLASIASGSTSFNFSAPIPVNHTYSVTVSQQPTGQNCTVNNGTGTMILGSNVAGVSVVCVNTYPLSGSVSGLAPGQTLTLVKTIGGQQAAVSFPTAGLADPANFTGAGTVGWSFSLAGSRSITSLGLYNTEFNANTTVGIWNSAGTLVASGLFDTNLTGVDLSDLANSNFLWLPISSLNLGAGTYTIGAYSSADHFGVYGIAPTTASGLTVVKSSLLSFSSALDKPTSDFSGVYANGFFGPNLKLGAAVSTTEQITITSNGAFAFPTSMLNGDQWTVSVSGQPAGQTCTVIPPSGTAGVTNTISVTCTTNTYSVGGISPPYGVTGLGAGMAVTLLNNGADGITVGNGSFTFPSKLTTGAPYNVTVSPQPVGWTCLVLNGSGVISAANVTNVSVSCARNLYTVGGSVTGLASGKSVVLQLTGNLNGTNYGPACATVSSNAGYTCATQLPYQASYSVTIAVQPNGQYCAVTNGAGTVPAGNVTNVQVSCISPPVAPSPINVGYVTKQINLSWTPVSGATYYSVYKANTATSGYTKLSDVLTSDYSDTYVKVTDWISASYQIAACNQAGCTNSTAVAAFTNQAMNYIKASNTGAGDNYGFAVALSSDGNTLAVGAHAEDSNATGINGNQVDDSAVDSGAVYVYTRSGISWSQQAYLKASNANAGDNFGISVSLSADGNTLAVGAFTEASAATGVNSNQLDNTANAAGATYVFTRSGTNWSQQAYIKASNTGAGDQFGYSVALAADGNTLVVGAFFEDSNATGINGNQADNSAANSGAVYVFTRSGATWSQQAYVKASNANAGDWFGVGVAISNDGNTLAVSAWNEASNATGVNGNQLDNSASAAGAVYVFSRSGATWSQQAYIKASNTTAGNKFGDNSIAISGDGNTLAVGELNESSNATGVNGDQLDKTATGSGAVYVFTRSGTSWSQQAYVKSSNTWLAYNFGSAVALSTDGNVLAVGSWQEGSNSVGVNGTYNNSALQSGATYLFNRNGTTWSQTAYIKSSNTNAYDVYGFAVALSSDGSTLAVGAMYEDSAATGINGNQSDNASTDAGAVYVY